MSYILFGWSRALLGNVIIIYPKYSEIQASKTNKVNPAQTQQKMIWISLHFLPLVQQFLDTTAVYEMEFSAKF